MVVPFRLTPCAARKRDTKGILLRNRSARLITRQRDTLKLLRPTVEGAARWQAGFSLYSTRSKRGAERVGLRAVP